GLSHLLHRPLRRGVFMRSIRSWRAIYAAPTALLIAYASILGAQGAASAKPTKQMSPADLKAWKNIRQAVLSNDGKWFAYVLAPDEGDASVIVRWVADGKETKYEIGDTRRGGCAR